MPSSDDIRHRFIEFFTDRGHTRIPGASLLPDNDTTVLFTSAGMQPLIPYFSGRAHPHGRRLVNYQRCLRTSDIDEVGDASHLTCFEMLGNWSLGDYFKHDSLRWSLELLTDGFGLDRDGLCVTVFAGDDEVPFDRESYDRWLELGIPPERIHRYGREHNWWGPPGPHGPCGPDSEVFSWTGAGDPEGDPASDERWMEVWNNVFISFELTPHGGYRPLGQQNVDTGMGLERLTCVLQGVESVYDTDLFTSIRGRISELSEVPDERAERIVCDHLRAAVLLLGDGVRPSNTDQGYVLRRLLRRAIRHGRRLGASGPFVRAVGEAVVERYGSVYPHLLREREPILDALEDEEARFGRTLQRGLREIGRLVERRDEVDGRVLFGLFETHGLPPELTVEELRAHGVEVPGWRAAFERGRREHQERSRQGSRQRFTGGLADSGSGRVVRLHTATHLLGAALREVLGDHVHQRGSNITEQRLRFDFSHPERLSDEQLARVEEVVNAKIGEGLVVRRLELPREEAEALGAEREFGSVYPDVVSVYVIGEFSKELCGGPHVENTREVGRFRIVRQESSGAGVRRIRAVVE
jgi:alanyl-tRNA synthetase